MIQKFEVVWLVFRVESKLKLWLVSSTSVVFPMMSGENHK